MGALAAVPVTGVRRVAIVAASGQELRQFCGSLLSEIVARRHRVLCIASEFSNDDVEALEELGVEHAVFDA
ncbi:MAG: hypothetical protein V3U85_05075, partial [Hyphomicrobium sp.]